LARWRSGHAAVCNIEHSYFIIPIKRRIAAGIGAMIGRLNDRAKAMAACPNGPPPMMTVSA
jgi:hypothetical protein